MPDLSIQTYLPKAREYLRQAQLTSIPDWSPDADFTVDPLGQGEYNMNFLVQQGQTKWVLRVNTGSQISISLPEQIAYEYNTLKLLSPSGVAPIPYFLDDSLKLLPYGVLGMSYLPGEKLDYNHDLEKAARLMARYHQIDVPEEENHLSKKNSR